MGNDADDDAVRSGPDPVAHVVTGYLIDQVKEMAGADRELFERAHELYLLAERGGLGHQARPRLEALRKHPVVLGALRVFGRRVRHLVETGLQISGDNEAMMEELRRRLAEQGVDAANPEQRAAAHAEYERVLADTVPLDVSLGNVEAIAETIELTNDLLNTGSALKRRVFEQAYRVGSRFVVEDESLRERMDELKAELTGDPKRLTDMARLVREAGPDVVREAYRRGSVKRGGTPRDSVLVSGSGSGKGSDEAAPDASE